MKLDKGFSTALIALVALVCCVNLGVVRGDDSTRSLLGKTGFKRFYGGYHSHGYNNHHHHHGYGHHWGRKLMEPVATTRWATSTNTKGMETSSSRSLLATPTDTTDYAPLATNEAKDDVQHNDSEDGKSRNLLGTQAWGSELVPHGDHFDRVPVWDATRSNGWANHNHYSGGYGGYGGHGHGRWLKSETEDKALQQAQEDNQQPADEATPAEATPAEVTPAEVTPAKATPAEATPAEVTPAESTPAEVTPAEVTPAEVTPAEVTPAEVTPAESTPAESTPAEVTPAEVTPAESTPAEVTPAEVTPAESTPAESTPAESTPAEVTQVAPAESTPAATDNEDGKSRDLLGAQAWGSELVPHGDHFDRVPVWDTTRSNGWANHNHYSGGYGGNNRRGRNDWRDNRRGGNRRDDHDHDHDHRRRLLSETQDKESEHTEHSVSSDVQDKEDATSRTLLGTQEWGSELVPHGDHFDRVPVWDSTRSNSWDNHHHYSGGYGGYGGHGHGRWLKSETEDKTPEQPQTDKQQESTPAESTTASADKEDGKSRDLLGAQAWGSTLVPHGDHFDRVPVWTPSHSKHYHKHNHGGRHGGRRGRWLLSQA